MNPRYAENISGIDALANILTQATSVVVATGAGVSAESGIPTFRDPQDGLWSRYRPQDLATPEAFARDPVTVWNWYQWRRQRLARVAPNAGHFALAHLERILPSFRLITQNVDGLHAAAGNQEILELHGNIRRNRCSREGTVSDWMPSESDKLPACPDCRAPLRPDVVWFGESLDPTLLRRAVEAAGRADVFLSVGTSALVEPAASLGRHADSHGAMIAEINPERTPLTDLADIFIQGKSGEVLPRLMRRVLAILEE